MSAASRKKILMLGAAAFQLPPILYARSRGYEVITCDNQPGNPGHALADRCYDVSTVDAEAVLEVARSESVDGILSYGSDVSAPTAALVADDLGLPGNLPEAVDLLTDKAAFRAFLSETGVQHQRHRCFGPGELDAIRDFVRELGATAIIKPVDASGSKGVALLDGEDDAHAISEARAASRTGNVIVEEYIQKQGHQVCGDGFVQDGELVFVEFGDGHFCDDGVHHAPYAETFPSLHADQALHPLRDLLARIVKEVGLERGPINIDALIRPDSAPFVIEIGPRAGGNFLPTAIGLRRGVDLVGACVESALDPHFALRGADEEAQCYSACYMLHSRAGGVLRRASARPGLAKHLVECNMYQPCGASIDPFTRANAAIGNLVLRFSDPREMHHVIRDMDDYFDLQVDPA